MKTLTQLTLLLTMMTMSAADPELPKAELITPPFKQNEGVYQLSVRTSKQKIGGEDRLIVILDPSPAEALTDSVAFSESVEEEVKVKEATDFVMFVNSVLQQKGEIVSEVIIIGYKGEVNVYSKRLLLRKDDSFIYPKAKEKAPAKKEKVVPMERIRYDERKMS